MIKTKMKLLRIRFTFIIEGVRVYVSWIDKGKRTIAGREYPNTYDVIVSTSPGKVWESSYRANVTNSMDYVNASLQLKR